MIPETGSPSAVPHLMNLMRQPQLFGTNVTEDTLQSIMRSENNEGIEWLWREVGGEREASLKPYAESVRANMRRYAVSRPDSMVSRVIKR